MSSQDILNVQQILSDILSNDNSVRGLAEKRLEELRNNQGALVFCLSQILVESSEKAIKTLASVLIRKTLDIKESDSVNPIWKGLDETFKNAIKTNLLQSILKEPIKSQKIKYCDTMATVAENVFESKEGWADLFNFIYEGVSLSPLPENLANIETVLFLMSQIFGYIYDELVPKLASFIITFEGFFLTDNFDLKTRTSQVIGEILSIVPKKESKKFKEFIPKILEHAYKCLVDEKQENNLKLCLMAISDLASSEPNILRKWFADIFILLGKVIENKNLEESNLRDLSFEIIVTLVESHPKLLKDDKSKLDVFIKTLFKYALEMDMELTDEWTSPKTLTFLEEDVVPEPQLQLALGMVERLCSVLDSSAILEILVLIVQDLLGNSSTEWRYKYTAFMILTTMCDEVKDLSEIKNILPTVFQNLQSEHPKIRFACMQVIEAAIDQFSPHIHEQFHKEITPYLLTGINDPILRCQLQCSETINAFIDTCPEDILGEHVKSVLDVLFPLLLNENVFVSLKENILNVLSTLVTNSDDDKFKPYAEQCLDILLKVFSNSIQIGKDKSIYGSLIELITAVGPNCESKYKTVVPDLVTAMIGLQNSIPYSTDPLFENLNSAWEKLIPIIVTDFTNLISPIIECTLKLVSNVPTMQIKSAPNQAFNINELLKDDSQDPKIVKQKVQVNTSETQDYAASISLLSTVIEQFGNNYIPYLEHTEKVILPLLTFEVNDEIRMEAANIISSLIEIVKKLGKVDVLHATAKNYLSLLILALEKETSNGAIACQLDAVGSLIEKVGLFLQHSEIPSLFVKLLEIFDKVEKSRLELIKRRETTAVEYEKDRQEGNNKINSDDEEDDDEEEVLEDMKKDIEEIEDVLVSIADIMGSMFKTHKELTLDIVQSLVSQLLPKYFAKEASSFENKMGLYIIDDMIEFLGQNSLPHLWSDLARTILTYADDKEPFLRQAAVYGIGEFAVNTTKDFASFAPALLEGIDKSLRYNSDGQSQHQWSTARDNSVAALGKIIKYQSSNIDLPTLVKVWVENLPLTEDDIEGQKQHKIFVELLTNSHDLVFGPNKEHLPKVIRILGKICDTKFVEDATNKEIKVLIQNIKANEAFAPFVHTAIEESNKEIKAKLTELFK